MKIQGLHRDGSHANLRGITGGKGSAYIKYNSVVGICEYQFLWEKGDHENRPHGHPTENSLHIFPLISKDKGKWSDGRNIWTSQNLNGLSC